MMKYMISHSLEGWEEVRIVVAALSARGFKDVWIQSPTLPCKWEIKSDATFNTKGYDIPCPCCGHKVLDMHMSAEESQGQPDTKDAALRACADAIKAADRDNCVEVHDAQSSWFNLLGARQLAIAALKPSTGA